MKKIISIILSLLMICSTFSGLSISANATETETTVYFVNTKGWSNVYCYVWTAYGAEAEMETDWPGTLATIVDEANGVYSYDVKTYENFIFNDDNGHQTTDLYASEHCDKYYEPKTETSYATLEEALEASEKSDISVEENTSLSTIYFDNSLVDWSEVYVYGWDYGFNNETKQMTQIGGTEIWKLDLPEPIPVGEQCILFKNTAGGSDWVYQSNNVEIVSGYNCYLLEDSLTRAYSWSNYIENEEPATEPKENTDFEYEISGDGTASITCYTGSATEVEIPSVIDGYIITVIGECAFAECSDLTSVTIPNSVEYIADFAFSECSGLTDITIPISVISIGGWVFKGCSSLTSVIIPEGVTAICDGSFYDCSSLASITIPDSVTFIGSDAFRGCNSLTDITIPEGVTTIEYNTFNGCSGLTSITIPDSVTTINDSSFYECSGLTSVTIPYGVTSIGNNAFAFCSGLSSVTIPYSVTYIGSYAFWRCSNLTSVTIPNSVTSISDGMFSECSGLTNVIIPNGVITIGYNSFSGCTGLTSVTIPNGVTTIDGYAFAACSGLTSVTIPDGVKTIGYNAFVECSGLTRITIPNSVTTIDESAFWNCYDLIIFGYLGSYAETYANENGIPFIAINSSENTDFEYSVLTDGTASITGYTGSATELEIPSQIDGYSVTTIGYYAFYECSSLTDITIPDSVTIIGDFAFCACYNLTSVTIPDSVTTIGEYVFGSCESLTNITIPDSVTTISAGAFAGCSGLIAITIPDSVTAISAYAFEGCSGLTSITIPDGVTTIGGDAFGNCDNLTILGYTGSCAETYANENGIAFIDINSIEDDSTENTDFEYTVLDDGTVSITGYTGSATELEIPSQIDGYSVTTIGYYAFYECSSLTDITIPDSVTIIGDFAFAECSDLTSVTIPNSVEYIADYAFCDCSRLTSIIIPDSVTVIGWGAFCGCESLTNISIPDSVITIEAYAFVSCTSLSNITLSNSVTTIGDSAFNSCHSLTSVTIPDSVTTIGCEVFYYCFSLTSITIPESVISIGDDAFYGCDDLTIFGYTGSYAESYATANEIPFVALVKTVNITGDIDLTLSSDDSVTYTGTVALDAGQYAFKISEFGTEMGFGYTFDNNLYNIKYNANYKSSTVLNATGGEYTFTYNAETDTLNVRHTPYYAKLRGDFGANLVTVDGVVYSGSIQLAAGDYSGMYVSLKGENKTFDTINTDGSGLEINWSLNDNGTFDLTGIEAGIYSFVYDSSADTLKITGTSNFDSAVSIFGDINHNFVTKDEVLYTKVVVLNEGTYKFRLKENSDVMCFGYTFTNSMYNIKYSSDWKAETTLKITEKGTYLFKYNTSTNSLTFYKV